MTATELIEILLPMPGTQGRVPATPQKAETIIVSRLLGDEPLAQTPVCEASVHRPARGQVYVAAFTGPAGAKTGQHAAGCRRVPGAKVRGVGVLRSTILGLSRRIAA